MTGSRHRRERVEFQVRAMVDDGMGNVQSGEWVTMHTCAARVMPKLGGENVLAQRLTGTQPMLITVRGCGALRDLATDWRVRDVRKNIAYDITSISNPDERGKFIEVLAIAGQGT
jgi:head-tail adaptor